METWLEQYKLWLARDKIFGKLRWNDKLKLQCKTGQFKKTNKAVETT